MLLLGRSQGFVEEKHNVLQEKEEKNCIGLSQSSENTNVILGFPGSQAALCEYSCAVTFELYSTYDIDLGDRRYRSR